MKRKIVSLVAIVSLVSSFFLASFYTYNVWAQNDAAPAAEAAPAAPAGDAAAIPTNTTFLQIILNSGWYGILDWLMIFATSIATVALIIDGFMTIRPIKIMPPDLVNAVRTALDQGDLGAALEACTNTPGPLANILMAGFNNVSEGYDVIMDCVSSAAEMESEKLMQRINYLNLCGAMGPMLGLLGTVTGMVDAFAGLATATGAAKNNLIALSISQALYTTVFGLMISIPAVLGFTLLRNNANKIILSMESLTYDLLKVLRGAEVVDGQEGGGEGN